MLQDWPTLLIAAAVITVALLLLGLVWNLVKRFLKIWLVILILLAAIKLAADAGLIAI